MSFMRPAARLAGIVLALGVGASLTGCVVPGPALYVEGEQEELERTLAGTPVTVIRRGEDIILRMPSDITFAVNRAELAPTFLPVLEKVSNIVAKYSNTTVHVTGHADSTGENAYNQMLSERRAQSVGSYFASRGIGTSRLFLDGKGESAPIASNDTEEGRAANRRVEIALEPLRLPAALPLAQAQPARPPF